MTTQETDAELEKFIHYELNHLVDDFQEIGQENKDNIKIVCRMVAAFSAKRAREKAIEECILAIEKAKPLVGPSGESRGQVNSFHKKLSGLNLAIAQIKSL